MNLSATALLLLDLQNDFIHAKGAYARGNAKSVDITALPARLKPLVDAFRKKGGLVAATLFTLVPGRGGEPIISPHLQALRPFLRKGDFLPGSWGQQFADELGPADVSVEKISFSGFYMTRLEWVLRKCGIDHVVCAGIVTNGGVASTVRDAHVREFHCTVLEDGCATFSRQMHEAAIEGLRPVADIATIAEYLKTIET